MSYDEVTGKYSDGGTDLASKISGDCTCSNYLREIEYTVDLEKIVPEDKALNAYFQIKKITADIVLGSTALTSTCGEFKGVNQKFSIVF